MDFKKYNVNFLDVKRYVKQRKEALRQLPKRTIKLGIIDGTDREDTGNQIYIRNKIKDFQEMGDNWSAQVYPVEINVKEAIEDAIADNCTSIIVQLPLRYPHKLDILNDLPFFMDCDGIHPLSLVNPATPKGIVDYLTACGFPFSCANAVVLGRSNIVGKPLAKLLLQKNATVSICHSYTSKETRQLLLSNADLVICAIGKPHFITRDECPKAFVVDVGINRDEKGKVCGDFLENEFYGSGRSTPVPGGVGLLTRLALLENCYELAAAFENEG